MPSKILGTVALSVLIALGAQGDVPIGPVPISLQSLFVVLAGLLLGPVRGVLAILLYLMMGCVGLPVFADGASGVSTLSGPTGGYLFGFVFAAATTGFAVRDPEKRLPEKRLSWGAGMLWSLLATLVIFLCGVPRLKYVLDLEWGRAVEVGMLPFLPGGVVKAALAVVVYRAWTGRRAVGGSEATC